MTPAASGRLASAAGLLAVAAAALLAAWGLGFGLPFDFRPDEDVMVGRAVRMAAEGSLDPRFTNYPPLVFYIFAAAEKLTGNLAGPTIQDPSGAYLTARAVSAAAFVATVALVFLAARRAYGEAAGVVAAFALALAPLAVRQAHMATTDGIQTLFVAATLLLSLRASRGRGFAGAGALVGLAAASKYTGGVALIFVVAMALQGSNRRSHCLAAVGGAAAAFALTSAVFVAHPADYLGGLAFLGGRGYARDFGTPPGWIYHPTVTLPFGLGLGAYALALVGIVVAALRREPADRALLAYLLGYLLVTGASREVFWRYMLPLLPALAMLAGGFLRWVPRRRLVPAVVVALLLLLPSLSASASGDRLLTATDTRRQAAEWLVANASDGSGIKTVWWVGPFYDQEEVAQNRRYSGSGLAAGFMQGRYTTRFRVNPDRPDFVIVASSVPGQAPPAALPGQTPVATFSPGANGGVYDPIDSFYVPIWGFAGVQRPGPFIAIYAR